jgi:hypothetical protein
MRNQKDYTVGIVAKAKADYAKRFGSSEDVYGYHFYRSGLNLYIKGRPESAVYKIDRYEITFEGIK